MSDDPASDAPVGEGPGDATATRPARAARRHDPGRRDRILDAALDVISEHGVAGTTHRRVAAAADVPLGSMTYHFADLDEVLRLAFERHADAAAARYEASMAQSAGGDVADRIARLVCEETVEHPRDLVLALELYALAARRPEFRQLTQAWMQRSRRALEQHVDPTSARALDAVVEGLVLHTVLSTEPFDARRVRALVGRLVG